MACWVSGFVPSCVVNTRGWFYRMEQLKLQKKVPQEPSYLAWMMGTQSVDGGFACLNAEAILLQVESFCNSHYRNSESTEGFSCSTLKYYLDRSVLFCCIVRLTPLSSGLLKRCNFCIYQNMNKGAVSFWCSAQLVKPNLWSCTMWLAPTCECWGFFVDLVVNFQALLCRQSCWLCLAFRLTEGSHVWPS